MLGSAEGAPPAVRLRGRRVVVALAGAIRSTLSVATIATLVAFDHPTGSVGGVVLFPPRIRRASGIGGLFGVVGRVQRRHIDGSQETLDASFEGPFRSRRAVERATGHGAVPEHQEVARGVARV